MTYCCKILYASCSGAFRLEFFQELLSDSYSMQCEQAAREDLYFCTHHSVNSLEQGWAASTNLREESSVFRVVASFLYFFLLNNMKEWCFFKYMNFHRSCHFLLRFKDIRCTWISWSFEIFLYAVTCYLPLLGFNFLIWVWWLQILSLRLLLLKADWSW